jgi:DNA repair exonuclease SbcCD ATPase subunit
LTAKEMLPSGKMAVKRKRESSEAGNVSGNNQAAAIRGEGSIRMMKTELTALLEKLAALQSINESGELDEAKTIAEKLSDDLQEELDGLDEEDEQTDEQQEHYDKLTELKDALEAITEALEDMEDALDELESAKDDLESMD